MPTDALSYVLQGVAQGAPQGVRLGLLGQEQRTERAKVAAASEAAKADAAREQMKIQIDRGKVLLDGLKEAPSKLKPDFYRAFATFSNENFGTALDPAAYTDQVGNDLAELTKLVDMKQKNLISDDDFFYGAGKYISTLDEGQQNRAKNVLQPILDFERVQRTGASVAGEQPLGAFATRQVLRLSGLTDKQIDEGQKTGAIPRQLKAKEAQLIIPRGVNFNFSNFGSPSATGGLNADSVSSEFGF